MFIASVYYVYDVMRRIFLTWLTDMSHDMSCDTSFEMSHDMSRGHVTRLFTFMKKKGRWGSIPQLADSGVGECPLS